MSQLLLAHTSCHLAWVALDACNNGVGERDFLGAFIQLLDNDDLFAGLTALEDDGDLCSKNTSIPQFKPPPPPNYHIPSRACILDQTFSKVTQSREHLSLPLTILINDEELDYDYLEYDDQLVCTGKGRGGFTSLQNKVLTVRPGQVTMMGVFLRTTQDAQTFPLSYTEC